MLPSAYGLGQHFQDLGHSFSPYGPPSRQITYIYFLNVTECDLRQSSDQNTIARATFLWNELTTL